VNATRPYWKNFAERHLECEEEMLIAIDTATDQASLALHDGFRVRAEYTWEAPRRHTTELTPRLADAMEQIGLEPDQLSGVAVARGPGSFTGLRIGVAVAKGLALAWDLPLIAIPTLDIIAAAQGRDDRPLGAVIQAGRGRICLALYRWQRGAWHLHEMPRLMTWEKLAEELSRPMLFCGEIDPAGADILDGLAQAEVLPAASRLRRAGFLAELAWQRLNQGDINDLATLTPIYLQHPV
jgi:tRNA threonylcarbamoyladenosine biosynthesis protein TsaB